MRPSAEATSYVLSLFLSSGDASSCFIKASLSKGAGFSGAAPTANIDTASHTFISITQTSLPPRRIEAHHVLVAQVAQQPLERPAQDGMDQLGRQLAERLEHEAAVVQLEVRHL